LALEQNFIIILSQRAQQNDNKQLWILGIFCTSLTMGIEAIAGLISIHLHFRKLSGRNQLQTATLSYNHVIKLILEKRHAPNSQSHHLALENMMSKQKFKIKSSIVNTNN